MKTNFHNIRISNDLYNEIKDYCTINNLKINVFVNDLLEKSLKREIYGDVPAIFTVNTEVEKVEKAEITSEKIKNVKKTVTEETNITEAKTEIKENNIVNEEKEILINTPKIEKPAKRRLK